MSALFTLVIVAMTANSVAMTQIPTKYQTSQDCMNAGSDADDTFSHGNYYGQNIVLSFTCVQTSGQRQN